MALAAVLVKPPQDMTLEPEAAWNWAPHVPELAVYEVEGSHQTHLQAQQRAPGGPRAAPASRRRRRRAPSVVAAELLEHIQRHERPGLHLHPPLVPLRACLGLAI